MLPPAKALPCATRTRLLPAASFCLPIYTIAAVALAGLAAALCHHTPHTTASRDLLAGCCSQTMVWRRLPAFLPNLRLQLLPLTSAQEEAYSKTGFLREIVLKTAPSVSKVRQL
jgi:hypothetical protein